MNLTNRYQYIPGPCSGVDCEFEIPVLYWIPEDGWFIDEDGRTIQNPYEYITPDVYRHFLYYKCSDLYEVRPGVFVELVFPDWFSGD